MPSLRLAATVLRRHLRRSWRGILITTALFLLAVVAGSTLVGVARSAALPPGESTRRTLLGYDLRVSVPWEQRAALRPPPGLRVDLSELAGELRWRSATGSGVNLPIATAAGPAPVGQQRAGSQLLSGSWPDAAGECSLTRAAADLAGWGVGDRLSSPGLTCRLVGITRPKNDFGALGLYLFTAVQPDGAGPRVGWSELRWYGRSNPEVTAWVGRQQTGESPGYQVEAVDTGQDEVSGADVGAGILRPLGLLLLLAGLGAGCLLDRVVSAPLAADLATLRRIGGNGRVLAAVRVVLPTALAVSAAVTAGPVSAAVLARVRSAAEEAQGRAWADAVAAPSLQLGILAVGVVVVLTTASQMRSGSLRRSRLVRVAAGLGAVATALAAVGMASQPDTRLLIVAALAGLSLSAVLALAGGRVLRARPARGLTTRLVGNLDLRARGLSLGVIAMTALLVAAPLALGGLLGLATTPQDRGAPPAAEVPHPSTAVYTGSAALSESAAAGVARRSGAQLVPWWPAVDARPASTPLRMVPPALDTCFRSTEGAPGTLCREASVGIGFLRPGDVRHVIGHDLDPQQAAAFRSGAALVLDPRFVSTGRVAMVRADQADGRPPRAGAPATVLRPALVPRLAEGWSVSPNVPAVYLSTERVGGELRMADIPRGYLFAYDDTLTAEQELALRRALLGQVENFGSVDFLVSAVPNGTDLLMAVLNRLPLVAAGSLLLLVLLGTALLHRSQAADLRILRRLGWTWVRRLRWPALTSAWLGAAVTVGSALGLLLSLWMLQRADSTFHIDLSRAPGLLTPLAVAGLACGPVAALVAAAVTGLRGRRPQIEVSVEPETGRR